MKRKCRPSGRNCGEDWLLCCDSNRVAAEASPPSQEMRKIGPPGFVEKTIVPSLFHAPPRGAGATDTNVFTDPPSMLMNLSLLSAKNPMDRLSGDQNGDVAPSVP